MKITAEQLDAAAQEIHRAIEGDDVAWERETERTRGIYTEAARDALLAVGVVSRPPR